MLIKEEQDWLNLCKMINERESTEYNPILIGEKAYKEFEELMEQIYKEELNKYKLC